MRAVLAALSALGLGCASFVNGAHVDLPLRSQPDGASFELRDYEGELVASGQTPATVSVARGAFWSPARYELTLEKPGYLVKRFPLDSRMDSLGFLDSLVILPGIVDDMVGATWQIDEPPTQLLSPDVPFAPPPP